MEVVLFGRSDGTTIIDVTDPVNPVILSNVPTATVPSLWRDIKVIGDVAFIVSEAGEHGMQIVDLSSLPGMEPGGAVGTFAHYTGFGNAHNVVANPATGFVYGVGTDTFNGGLHVVDVNEPSNPMLVGSWDEDYIHDAQAVIYNGPDEEHQGQEIVLAFSGYSGFHVIDATDKSDIQTLSSIQDSSWVYVHQGWFTEDQRFVFMNDEIDESSGVADWTRTWVIDVQDLDNPVVVGFHEGTHPVTDHNLYTHEGRVYAANYYAGIQVFDIVNPEAAELEMVAHFDTNPFSNQVGTSGGAWNVYPFFDSGNIAISTQSHFFMVRPSMTSDIEALANRGQWTAWSGPEALHLEANGPVRLQVVDVMGRCVADWPVPVAGRFSFTTAGWPSGCYFIRSEAGQSQRVLVR